MPGKVGSVLKTRINSGRIWLFAGAHTPHIGSEAFRILAVGPGIVSGRNKTRGEQGPVLNRSSEVHFLGAKATKKT